MKTIVHDGDVDAFVAAVSDPVRRADATALRALIECVSGEPARMWGTSIVGCGEYRYRSGGHEQRMCAIGFAPRKVETVLYLAQDFADRAAMLARLGPHRTGRRAFTSSGWIASTPPCWRR